MWNFPFAALLLLCWTILFVAETKATIDPCNKPEFCTPDTKTPDPEDCASYYWCVNGFWMKMNCSIGTLFDNVTLECNYPDLVHCQPECLPFTGSTTDRVTQDPAQIPKATIDPCNKDEFCTPDTKTPDPEDCASYYWCVTGFWLKMNCSIGTLFDNVTLECDYPHLVHCQPECPPFTGSTTERVTQKPGTCENITQCIENKKYPDRSNCQNYYLCTGGNLVPQSCPAGLIFDIYIEDCTSPYDGFDCYYRCATPAPTTDAHVTWTSGSTPVYDTSGLSDSSSSTLSSSTLSSSTLSSSTLSSSTLSSSTSSIVPPGNTNTGSSPSGSSNEAVLIGIIIGVVVVVIIVIIIIVVICLKKHKSNKVDPESVSVEDGLSREFEPDPESDPVTNVNEGQSNRTLLPPIVMAAEASGKEPDFDHSAFIAEVEKEKRRRLRRFKMIDPSGKQAIKAAKKYKKKLREDLKLRYEAEEKRENDKYNEDMNLLSNDGLVKRQNFRIDLRTAYNDRNDPTELTALANNHVNSQHVNSIARQEVMNGRDRILRTRLKNMNLTEEDMLNAGLRSSDLDGSDMEKRIRTFNKEQEMIKDAYLEKFKSMVTSGASLRDLEKLTDGYESQLTILHENHVHERNEDTQRLLTALNTLALQNLDKLWNKECKAVDKDFDYSVTPEDDPGAVKETLAQHLEALKKAGEEIDNHITNRNLSVALATLAKLEHDSQMTTTSPTDESVTMETSTRTRPLPDLLLPMETIVDRNDEDGETPDESIPGARGVNGIRGRSMTPSSENLERQRMILAIHQQQVEQLQAMRMREKSKMDELLRKKLSERKTEARGSSNDAGL